MPTDGSADYTHAGAPTPTPIQLSQTSPDNKVLYLGRPGQNNSASPTISCQENIQLMPTAEEDDDWDSDSDFNSNDAHASSSWSVRICFNGPERESFCTTQGIPSEILDTTWSASCLDILIEQIGFAVHIPDLAPVKMSHQLDQQRDSSRRLLYVKERW